MSLFVKLYALLSVLSGAVLSFLGILPLLLFFQGENWGRPLDNANLVLLWTTFLVVGMPQFVVVLSWFAARKQKVRRGRISTLIDIVVSSIPGAFLTAVSILSLPILPTGYVLFEGMPPVYSYDLRPRLFGFSASTVPIGSDHSLDLSHLLLLPMIGLGLLLFLGTHYCLCRWVESTIHDLECWLFFPRLGS